VADAISWGAPPEVIDAMRAEDALFAVAPENWPVICAWCAVDTQWRMGPRMPIGLDYPAVFVTLDRCRIADHDGAVFAGLQVMERAALREFIREA
jgi:Phage related hypothetical protein (DUF1799)